MIYEYWIYTCVYDLFVKTLLVLEVLKFQPVQWNWIGILPPETNIASEIMMGPVTGRLIFLKCFFIGSSVSDTVPAQASNMMNGFGCWTQKPENSENEVLKSRVLCFFLEFQWVLIWLVVSDIFWNFHPDPWGRWFPIWRAYFSDGLKPPRCYCDWNSSEVFRSFSLDRWFSFFVGEFLERCE